jgi:DNA ligase-1
MRRYRRIRERQRIFNEIPVKIFFFDVLYFKQSLIEETYEKRRKILETIVKNNFQLTQQRIREDKSPEEIDTLDKVKSIAGFEAPYEA